MQHLLCCLQVVLPDLSVRPAAVKLCVDSEGKSIGGIYKVADPYLTKDSDGYNAVDIPSIEATLQVEDEQL